MGFEVYHYGDMTKLDVIMSTDIKLSVVCERNLLRGIHQCMLQGIYSVDYFTSLEEITSVDLYKFKHWPKQRNDLTAKLSEIEFSAYKCIILTE